MPQGSSLNEAKKIATRKNWNIRDKAEIRVELLKKLRAELESKDFLNVRKFEIMEEEMDKVLKEMDLDE